MTGITLPAQDQQDGLELSSSREHRLEGGEQAEQSTALLFSQPGSVQRETKVSDTVAANAASSLARISPNTVPKL